MGNILTITAADNQLVFIAYNDHIAYEICNVQSGYNAPVNVTIAIVPGEYVQVTPIYGGEGQPINQTLNVSIPQGSYNMVAFGKNWGLEADFAATFHFLPIAFGPNDSGSGIQFTSTPLTLQL